jgi:hypothetical protein
MLAAEAAFRQLAAVYITAALSEHQKTFEVLGIAETLQDLSRWAEVIVSSLNSNLIARPWRLGQSGFNCSWKLAQAASASRWARLGRLNLSQRGKCWGGIVAAFSPVCKWSLSINNSYQLL